MEIPNAFVNVWVIRNQVYDMQIHHLYHTHHISTCKNVKENLLKVCPLYYESDLMFQKFKEWYVLSRNYMMNYKKLTWDIEYLKTHSHIDLDNDVWFIEKNDLNKNICINLKLYWKMYPRIHKFMKLVHRKFFAFTISISKFYCQFYIIFFWCLLGNLYIYIYIYTYIYIGNRDDYKGSWVF